MCNMLDLQLRNSKSDSEIINQTYLTTEADANWQYILILLRTIFLKLSSLLLSRFTLHQILIRFLPKERAIGLPSYILYSLQDLTKGKNLIPAKELASYGKVVRSLSFYYYVFRFKLCAFFK